MVQSPPRTNPFPGLRPFELDEEHLFFGREGQADELLTRLNLTSHTDWVWSVNFSPDGQTVASASADGTIILWNFDLDDLMAKSCNWLRDYMANPTTPTEDKALCEGYLPLSLLQSAALGPLQWVANVRAFLSTAIARP